MKYSLVAALTALTVAPAQAWAGAAPPTPPAAPVLTAPAAGAATGNSRPVFTWSIDPENIGTLGLEVGSKPTEGPDGLLGIESIVHQFNADERTVTTYTPTLAEQLYTGRWYWRVQAVWTSGVVKSNVRLLVVKKRVLTPQLSIKSTAKGTSGIVKINLNTKGYALRVRVVHGDEVCYNKTSYLKRERVNLARWDAFKIYCYPHKPLESGTETKVTATVIAGGLTRATTRTAMVA